MPEYDPTLAYEIASNGTEQMWIETDGTPYVYILHRTARQGIESVFKL